MRVAVLGSGMIVQELLTVVDLIDGFDVVAIQGREASREKLELIAARHGIATVHTDLDTCLADPQVEAVYIGLPNDLHLPTARAALLAGKDVICEKPFVPTVAELDEIAALAAGRGRVLVEAISTVHLATYRALAEAAGRIGRIRLVESDYTQRSSRYDAFLAGETPPAFDAARGGGALMDLGIYTLHAIVGLLGRPDTVATHLTRQRGVDTSGVVVLGYPDAQAVAIYAKDSGAPSRTLVVGEEGSVELAGAPNSGGPVTVRRRGEPDVVLDLPEPPHRMVEEMREFVRIVHERDLDAVARLLDHSRTVVETLERARAWSLR